MEVKMKSIYCVCPMCKKVFTVNLVNDEINQYDRYENGEGHIQDFENLNKFEREALKTGYCVPCQSLLFGVDEEECHRIKVIHE